MKIKKERKDEKSFKELFKERFSGMTLKSYLIETGVYIKKHILKVSLIILAITLLSVVSVVNKPEMFKLEKANVTFWGEWIDRIQVLGIIVFAGIVPYMYTSNRACCVYFFRMYIFCKLYFYSWKIKRNIWIYSSIFT